MSMPNVFAEDRRLVILQTLEQDHDYAVNEDILKRVLAQYGHAISRDMLRADVQWLMDQRLVRVEELPGPPPCRIVHALEDGVDVATGRPFPGVARPAPR